MVGIISLSTEKLSSFYSSGLLAVSRRLRPTSLTLPDGLLSRICVDPLSVSGRGFRGETGLRGKVSEFECRVLLVGG